MRRFNFYIAGLLVLSMFFTSCSDEENVVEKELSEEKAVLSFATVLNDFVNNRASKQAISEIPECSDGEPLYVQVALQDDEGNWVGGFNGDENEFIEIPIAGFGEYGDDGEDAWFTEESSELELEPGEYHLQYFMVFDEADELLWVAPRQTDNGEFQNFVSALPLEINLAAGTKKYMDIDVLCFDDRLVNEYGYLFFDIINTEVISLCVFGNFCNESGRHFPAHFRLEVWTYSGEENSPQGAPLFNPQNPYINEVGTNDDGDMYADPLCVYLPDGPGEDLYYAEIYLLEWGNAEDEGELIRSGVFDDSDVRSLYNDDDSTSEYYHFREDCTGEDSPALFEEGNGNGGGECDPNDPNADCDNDGVINSIDQCLDTDPGVEVDEEGCESIQVPGRDIVVFNDINIFDNTAMADPDNIRLVQNLVNFTTGGVRNNGDVVAFDFGRNSQCYNDGQCSESLWASMWDVIDDAGFTVEQMSSDSGTLIDIDSDIKTLFLVVPLVNYTVSEINALKEFAAEGGRIVFIGEHDTYYSGIALENQFLLDMGAVLHNTGGALDCGYTTIPSSSNREHPIMEGIDELTIACASVIEPGPDDFALFYDTTNTSVLAGVAKIDTNPVSELRPADNNKKVSAPRENISNPKSTTGF